MNGCGISPNRRWPKRNLQPGEPLVFSQQVTPVESNALLQPPVGEPIALLPVLEDQREKFEYHQTFIPGDYLLTVNPESSAEIEIPFHVMRDAEESNLQLMDEPQHELLTQAGGLRFTDNPLTYYRRPRGRISPRADLEFFTDRVFIVHYSGDADLSLVDIQAICVSCDDGGLMKRLLGSSRGLRGA